MDNTLISKVLDFIGKNPHGLIVVYGPTASGKSGLAIEVAREIQRIGSDLRSHQPTSSPVYSPFIISADSRQIYRGMDIGTGKITEAEQEGIPHHGIDLIDPSETFSVMNFRNYVENLEVWQTWHQPTSSPANQPTSSPANQPIPILCGGTGLYLDSLIYERDYMGKAPDPDRRKELEQFREKNGNEALWKELHAIDPRYAKTLHVNNWTYIIRGIEIMETTGKSKMEAKHGQTLKYPTLFLTPYDGDRERLYEKINTRVKQMFETGLIEEVGYIINVFSSHCPGLRTIGYKEVVDYLEGRITLEESISLVQQHNRNYAKRQITWNKKYEYPNPLF